MTEFLIWWACLGAVEATIWSLYVNGSWWSGTILGAVFHVVIWPLMALVLLGDLFVVAGWNRRKARELRNE